MGQRLAELTAWVSQLGPDSGVELQAGWYLQPVSGDASFRRYFRLVNGEQTWIVVDAPPELESSYPFVQIAQQWKAQGINVPDVLQADLVNGFMLQTDFGDELYLSALQQGREEVLYPQAIAELIRIQCTDSQTLPPYDSAMLLREMKLFEEWFVQQLLQLQLSTKQQSAMDEIYHLLERSALEQPQVTVHRDYHSRNLLVLAGERPGVIDFQGAMQGGVGYDLVSLLKDCYIAWPKSRVDRWCEIYLANAQAQGVLADQVTLPMFKRWFDLMGAQRHLKVLGIFSRLSIRDGKSSYLADIPLVLDYLLAVAKAYSELAALVELIDTAIKPSMRASHHFKGVSI